MRFLFVAFCMMISTNTHASAFRYDWKVDDSGYNFKLKMIFSKATTLEEVIYNLNDVQLPKLLNPTMEAVQKKPEYGENFDWTTRFKALGLTFSILSHCDVSQKQNGKRLESWSRHCILDPEALDSKIFLKRKNESILCTTVDHQVNCDLYVEGEIKSLPLLKSSKLTLKAKTQGLINWAKFWFFTNEGSISSKVSNLNFDHSRLSHDIEKGEMDGLERAKEDGPFSFERSGEILFPEARE